jgi:aminopeptidase N
MRKTTQGLSAAAAVTAVALLAPASVAYATGSTGGGITPAPVPAPGSIVPPFLSHGPGPVVNPLLSGAAFKPGALRGGDPYFPDYGNGGYRVAHYDLRLKYDPVGKMLDGTATLTARATQNLSSFGLDLKSTLNVSSVKVNGTAAKNFVQSGDHKLVITPAQGLQADSPFTVTVAYSGMPTPVQEPKGGLGVYGWVTTGDGAVALDQPVGASTWFPVNESNANKATYSYQVTVPKDLTVLANGEPTGAVPKGKTLKTYGWEMRRPMAPELASVAIGKFDVTASVTAGKMQDITAIEASLKASTNQRQKFNTTTADMLKWESGMFGRYPFDSTGGVLDTSNVGYSMESQGRPVYDTDTANLTPDAIITIAHEQAHQWFGDSLTPARWSDIWLNEGLATYTEWLYAEQHGGLTAQKMFDTTYALAAQDPHWRVATAAPGRNHIFDWAVYYRGAMTLHLLRTQLGDKAFFGLLRRWADGHRYGNVTTAQFIQLAEQVSHKSNLNKLLMTWLYSTGKPAIPK